VIAGVGPLVLEDVFQGREKLTEFVRSQVRSWRRFQSPILFLVGIGGSGRTAMLDRLAGEYARALPLARVDAAAVAREAAARRAAADLPAAPEGVAALLLRAAGDLMAPVPAFGRIRFHRLLLAQLALSQEIDPDATDPQELMVLRRELRLYRRNGVTVLVGKALAEAAPLLLEHLAGGRFKAWGGAARGAMLAGSEWAAANLRMPRVGALAAAEQWHIDRYRGEVTGCAAALQRVYRDERFVGSIDVDELMVAAFLADLRWARARYRWRFYRGRRWWLGYRCALMLDNAGHPAAGALLERIAVARDEHADPLVVVAAGGAPTGEVVAEETLPRLCAPELRDRRRLGIELPPLTLVQVTALVRARRTLDGRTADRAAVILHRIARGHPLATVRFLDAFCLDRSLLDDVGAACERLADELLTAMIGRSIPLRALLVVLAAARDAAEAERLADAEGDLRSQQVKSALASVLWPGRRLHPLVRFLALHELGGRSEMNGKSWQKVFDTLRGLAVKHNDLAGELHGELALGDVAGVARRLSDQLGAYDGTAWLALLDEVVATPDPRDTLTGTVGRIDGLTADEELPWAIGHLLVALRRLGDTRLTDHDVEDQLRDVVADQYAILGTRAPCDRGVFRDRAAVYDQPIR